MSDDALGLPRAGSVTPSRSLPTGVDSYYQPLGGGLYQPTSHIEGVWNPEEQHMGPVSGLLAHALETHEPREDLVLARISYDILGMIPARPSLIDVHVARPGRTIELVEAAMTVGGRTVVRAQGWRLARHDTAHVAGGQPEPMTPPEQWGPWAGSEIWTGGYFDSLQFRVNPDNVPGRGQIWMRSDTTLLDGVATSPTAAFVALVDTANGFVVRADPQQWAFPNVDLTIHLYREPDPSWVGMDTTVTFGANGVGLTSTVLHDVHGPVGRAEQILTIRPRTRAPGD